jgi:uncharacterized membrane protein
MPVKKEKVAARPRFQRLLYTLMLSNGVSLLLFALRSLESQTDRYWFLTWNLILAWLPVLFVWWLALRLRNSPWLSWQNIVLTLLWLGFLPNSFYLVSDLIHLHPTGEVSLLYDVVMFCSYIFNAYVAGFMSLFVVHRQLLKRIAYQEAQVFIVVVLLLCSFAIYLGRSLRWNSWDVLINPAGLLFDVSDRLVNPGSHPQALVTTATCFVLLTSRYFVLWEFARALRADKK